MKNQHKSLSLFIAIINISNSVIFYHFYSHRMPKTIVSHSEPQNIKNYNNIYVYVLGRMESRPVCRRCAENFQKKTRENEEKNKITINYIFNNLGMQVIIILTRSWRAFVVYYSLLLLLLLRFHAQWMQPRGCSCHFSWLSKVCILGHASCALLFSLDATINKWTWMTFYYFVFYCMNGIVR